jgi:hypothetical protein
MVPDQVLTPNPEQQPERLSHPGIKAKQKNAVGIENRVIQASTRDALDVGMLLR